ncbi:MAG: haloacid dehalogenase-like hydrolase [Anaerolineae bacterium]|nr:haloacid dehalogenase-like hydrolase [Gemmatimonadaceae bacterium]
MKLILFDIDGTLLWSDGSGRRAMEGALLEVFGKVTGPPEYRYDGKTDQQIVREVMRHNGRDDAHIDERMQMLLRRYLSGLEHELLDRSRGPHLFEGVLQLLDALEARKDVTLGLLTGNLREGAALKLRAVGIAFERFKIGAFGSDHEARSDLPALAQRRARETLGLDVSGDRIIVIGDTPADVECGRAIGARAIGVATGRFTTDELTRAGAAAVLENFRDTEASIQSIVGDGSDAGPPQAHPARSAAAGRGD